MKLTIDTKQRIQSGCIFILEFYKVLMGSFITLFVPHQCDDHICSMNEIFDSSDDFRMFVLFVNFVSCIQLLILYALEIKRENWCITYLDIDPKKPNNNLDIEIEDYPEYKKQMTQINKNYKNFSLACVVSQIFNILVSVIDLGMHWVGSVSLSPLIGYVILMLSKLYNTYFISNASLKKERAYSAYLTISKTYNTIDDDKRKDSNNL
jgi:hypothetical protein